MKVTFLMVGERKTDGALRVRNAAGQAVLLPREKVAYLRKLRASEPGEPRLCYAEVTAVVQREYNLKREEWKS